MDWLTKMNEAIDYIENNLLEDIDYSIVAQKACCSSYNFQRMFSFITDVSLAEYIRRRRLTQAALELQNSNTKVIDVALKYGYDSPVSFSRAFANIHGITPNEAKQSGAELKAYPKISFQISIKGEKEMNYRIETKEAFDVFGIETIASLSGEDGFVSPTELWQQSHQNGDYEKLFNSSGSLPKFISQDLCKIHGVENYRKTEGNTFPYMLCAFVSESSKTDDYKIQHIPPQTYAIFPSEKFKWDEDFNEVLRNLQKRFYSEWLPTANYQRVAGANFEIYGGDREYGYIELWFPVKQINITK
ncbi:AraC family transcriptional regulator [Anaeromicropila herbilytica]|uniref:AraC family transcriptional regulator n=1 Tax=Anaeromicropila herbilytica TaxID=2785025 RepID=A0A7R7EN50_9FIRM|nr:AraC family transcriptional regulator [Anaeromicropila herbilytica]BCN31920.1 AraC family transcriptional regulator [Anaeromicropila herbilytica]